MHASELHCTAFLFFAASGVQLAQSNLFKYRHAAFTSQLKSKVGLLLGKDLRVNLNIDGATIASRPRNDIKLFFGY